jgi:HSP20 family protein
VKVIVEGDVLTVAGEKKVERTDEKTHYSERSYGSFTRSFRLPADADAEKISARYGKGVLTLEIGKRANGGLGAKEIEIRPS